MNHIPDVTKMVTDHIVDANKKAALPAMTPELLAAIRAIDAYAGEAGNAEAWQGVGVIAIPIRLAVNNRIALKAWEALE